MRCFILGISFLLLLISCSNDSAGTISETELGIIGTIVNEQGQPVDSVIVIAYPMDNGMQGAAADTAVTDSKGSYTFNNLVDGNTYTLEAEKMLDTIQFKVIIYNVVYTKDNTLTVGTDTLNATGAVQGVVVLESGPVVGIDAYIPGTSFMAKSKAQGDFTISGVPMDTGYTIHFSYDDFLPAQVSNVTISADDTITLPDTVVLAYDPDSPIPEPEGLSAKLDTLTREVTLAWDSSAHPSVDGYLVYRKDSSQTAAATLISGSSIVKGLSFLDTVDALMLGESITYSYQIKAQDKKGNPSGFSWPAYVTIEGTINPLPDTAYISEPNNGATNVSTMPTIRWNKCGEGASYVVYLWQINGSTSDTIPFEHSDTVYAFSNLINGQEYGVRIESKNEHGSVFGPEITFTVEPQPTRDTIGSASTVRETFVCSGVSGNNSTYTDHNYGALQWMTLGEHDAQTAARALVAFDQSTLPQKAVKSARLLIRVSNWVDHSHENTEPMKIAVHKVLKEWNEGDSLPESGLHYNTHQIILDGIANSSLVNGTTAREATLNENWNAPMLALDDVDAATDWSDTSTHSMSEGVDFDWEFTITDIVNEWIANPTSNMGLLLKPFKENWSGKEISFPIFYTWEHEDSTSHGPRLILEFV